MHLNPSKTSLTRLCFRTRLALCRKENKAIKSFEGSFRNLNFSPSSSILLNFFFPFIDIRCFFLKFKTTVLSNNRFAKKPLFQKRRWSCDFPPRKTRLPKSTARFPAKKRWHSPPPVGLSWDFPPPPPESVRTDGRTYADVTTNIFRIDKLPNLLSNGAPLAGFARRLSYNLIGLFDRTLYFPN